MRSSKTDIGTWLQTARSELNHGDQSGLETRALLAHVLGKPVGYLLAHPDQALSESEVDNLEGFLERLGKGEPLAYLTGRQEFYCLSIRVTPDVLIPRPETEILVDQALEWLRNHPEKRLSADVGAGSGCIAAALAANVDDLRIVAVDSSRAALQVARTNLNSVGAGGRAVLIQGDLLGACGLPFDLVCANLPYIPSWKLPGLAVTQYEPLKALDGGEDGLRFVAQLLAGSPDWLAPDGLALIEIEAGQASSAPMLAQKWLPEAKVDLIHDLAGLPRIVRIERRG